MEWNEELCYVAVLPLSLMISALVLYVTWPLLKKMFNCHCACAYRHSQYHSLKGTPKYQLLEGPEQTICCGCFRYSNTESRDVEDVTSPLLKDAHVQCMLCSKEKDSTTQNEEISAALMVVLVCLHSFHRDCLLTWYERTQYCPTCKTDILVTSYISPWTRDRREYGRGRTGYGSTLNKGVDFHIAPVC